MAKFMELTTIERYELIGKIIDAMVYDDDAVDQVKLLVNRFESEGKIRSVFFPTQENNLENLNIENEEDKHNFY
jgi:hypothetical protein